MLSWNYPTAAAPQRGLWAQRHAAAIAQFVDVTVVVPTPWIPPFLPIPALRPFRRIPRRSIEGRVTVLYPRVPGSLEYLTHAFDAVLAWPAIRRAVMRVHADRPLHLVHAEFVYPEGVVAARLGQALGVPVMTTEQAFWTPWLRSARREGDAVRRALPSIALITAVSGALRDNIKAFVGDGNRVDVLPNVVDGETFTLPATHARRGGLLFVGLVRRVKGLDILLRALAQLRDQGLALPLTVLAAPAIISYRRDAAEIDALIRELRLESLVTFRYGAPPADVAQAMQAAALVVIPSRRETFCSVAGEALACGTPVVVTRCGGPEEFVTEQDGVLVPIENPQALADAIRDSHGALDRFDRPAMRRRILNRFSPQAIGERAVELYQSLLTPPRQALRE
jgi:glycosyltransferase involved in cell wall biosynthesis